MHYESGAGRQCGLTEMGMPRGVLGVLCGAVDLAVAQVELHREESHVELAGVIMADFTLAGSEEIKGEDYLIVEALLLED